MKIRRMVMVMSKAMAAAARRTLANDLDNQTVADRSVNRSKGADGV